MKFLVTGLGSMGKRRIRNLQYLNAGEITGFDPRADRREEAGSRYGVKTFAYFEEALAEDPDAIVISTPPDRHLQYALAAARHGKHFFAEAGVAADGLEELIAICRDREIVAAPSCTMRFQPSIRTIKKLVEDRVIGKIQAFTYHSGQYLPDWHPWEDYRSFYVSRRETGACREIVPFELVWLTWALGEVTLVSCFKGKLSGLDADIDDVYQLLLGFQGGTLGHMLVDVIARVPYRVLKLISDEGVISWDWREKCVRIFRADGEWEEYREPAGTLEKGYIVEEEMYINEMEQFLKAVRGEERYPYSLVEDKRMLQLLLAAERSWDNGIHIRPGETRCSGK